MKLVITGGFGYVGTYISKHLVSKGHEVIIFDCIDEPSNDIKLGCEWKKCDITNYNTLQSIGIQGVDAVLHLAAQSSGPNSLKMPEEDIKINIIGTLNMIKWCEKNKINRILFASSFVVYGDIAEKPKASENDPCNPKSIYALSKYYCERLLQIYAQSRGINWNILRMFNVFGPGQDMTRDDQGMVSIFLKKVKDSDDLESLKSKTEQLVQSSLKLGEAIYKQNPQDQTPQPDPSGEEPSSDKKNDKVVDADFEEVDEKKKD